MNDGMGSRFLAVVTAAAALALVPAGAAAGLGTTTTTSSTTTSTSTSTSTTSTTAPKATTTTVPPTTVVGTAPASLPGNATSLVQQDPEAPADEAKLLALIDNVNSRLSNLQSQIAGLNDQLTKNQASLDADTKILAARESAAYAADRRVDVLEVDRAAARLSMRTRAVAAYMHQPTDDLATMLLHLRDPADLVDARSFYQDLVESQLKAVKRFDTLSRSAKGAASQADQAREDVRRQQQTLAMQAQMLQSLKQAYQAIQQESVQQQAQQQSLLAQVGLDRAQFAAEVAAEAAQDANIEALLASLAVPGDTMTAAPVGAGFFSWPIPNATITSPFGPRIDPVAGYMGFHPGVDFGAALGTPIHAAGDGTVVFAGPEDGYGNYTCISHGGNVATCYAHQSVIMVTVGQAVTRGQVIGLVGSTGYSTGPHLHFEVRLSGKVTDPMPWLTGNPSGTTTTTTR